MWGLDNRATFFPPFSLKGFYGPSCSAKTFLPPWFTEIPSSVRILLPLSVHVSSWILLLSPTYFFKYLSSNVGVWQTGEMRPPRHSQVNTFDVHKCSNQHGSHATVALTPNLFCVNPWLWISRRYWCKVVHICQVAVKTIWTDVECTVLSKVRKCQEERESGLIDESHTPWI